MINIQNIFSLNYTRKKFLKNVICIEVQKFYFTYIALEKNDVRTQTNLYYSCSTLPGQSENPTSMENTPIIPLTRVMKQIDHVGNIYRLTGGSNTLLVDNHFVYTTLEIEIIKTIITIYSV